MIRIQVVNYWDLVTKDQDLSDNQQDQPFTGWEKEVIIYVGEKKCKEHHKLLLDPNPKQA